MQWFLEAKICAYNAVAISIISTSRCLKNISRWLKWLLKSNNISFLYVQRMIGYVFALLTQKKVLLCWQQLFSLGLLYILKDCNAYSKSTRTSKRASQLILQLVLGWLMNNKLCLNRSHSSYQLDRLGNYSGQIILNLFTVSSSNTDTVRRKSLVLSFALKPTKRKLGISLILQTNRGFSNSPGVYSNLGGDKVQKCTDLSKEKR